MTEKPRPADEPIQVPAEAVLAAARWLRERYTPDWWGQPVPTTEEFEGDARELLEAAIPFLTPHAHDDMPTSKPVSMPAGDLPYPQDSPAPSGHEDDARLCTALRHAITKDRDDLAAEVERLRADLETARTQLREYETATTWETTCTGCARLLTLLYTADMHASQLRDALADLAQVWQARRRDHEIHRETTDGPAIAASIAIDIYDQILTELAAALTGHGPAQTTGEQLAAVEARAARDAEAAAARIADLEQQITTLTGRTP